jgi:hypothetical protein
MLTKRLKRHRKEEAMAKIWPVYEGYRTTIGEPWADIPLSEAIDLFELRPHDFLSDLGSIPRFGNEERDLTYVGFTHIVVEVERAEARQAKWKAGYYKSRVKPKDAFSRLLRQALASELGDRNLVRVNVEPSVDSQNRQALRITVVIAPEAAQKLKGGAVLDALVSLQSRLAEMRDDRVPLIEYATEAELQQDGGP